MTNKELKNIISKIEESNKKEDALFGFYHQDGDENNTHIQANKQGLELFSAELLKARLEIENRNFENGNIEYLQMSIDWTDSNADFYFDNLATTKNIKTENEESFSKYQENWKDKLFGYLIFGIIVFLIFMLVVGIITTLFWFFYNNHSLIYKSKKTIILKHLIYCIFVLWLKRYSSV
ncbi:hypothetical protein N9V96_02915 [Polaribacter sp.]|nr:hypothetical protein [Polaribacter sp.]